MNKKLSSHFRRMSVAVCLLLAAVLTMYAGLFNSSAACFPPPFCSLQASAADVRTLSAPEVHNTPSATNILLIGQDQREGDVCSRADTILLCTFHPDSRKIIITSFLRDLYVPIPGYASNRLNAAYAHGGMSLLRQTLQENFDLSIDGCVEVDFSRFAEVLDILGGVTIDLRQDEADAINKTVPGTLTEGRSLLSGNQALAYTRIRDLDKDGDFSRTHRQRKVISSLLSNYRGASLFTILSVVPDVLPMLSTDMEQKQIISTIIQLLPMISESSTVSQQVPADGMYTYRTIRGMSVLQADLGKIRTELTESLVPGN